MRDAARTLLLPFDTGALDAPASGASWLFLNAEPVPLPASSLSCVQDERAGYLNLRQAGYAADPSSPDGPFDGALVLVSRSRGFTANMLADAVERVRPGGWIVVAGEKNYGIQGARKRLSALADIVGSLAKHHATVFWFRVSSGLPDIVTVLRPDPYPAAEGFATAPGVFSEGHVDEGSRLLAEALPSDLGGSVADFGAGWGYLAVEALRRNPGIERMELFESSRMSLAHAERNVAALAPHRTAAFHWHDLTREPVERRFDAVIMNPPFHEGRAAEPALGHAFIAAAAAALKPGGRLYTVANRQLPYEKALASAFRTVSVLPADADGHFKLFEAVR